MINWTGLSKKYGKKIISERFEKLALEYVKDIYSEYTWIPTKSGHDGNKDAHLGQGVDFDIWEEAKYKGGIYKIKRQDLDTTILSGIIQGNVKMIVFVSNATVPESLYSRADITSSMKGIEITYALDSQLEGWIYSHSEIFEEIFKEKINISIEETSIFSIKNIDIFNTFASEFNTLSCCTELIIGEKYIFAVTVDSPSDCDAKLIINEHFPFKIIDNDRFDNINNIHFSKGINTIKFLVLAYKEHYNKLSVRIDVSGHSYFKTTNDLLIYNQNNLPIVYSEQIKLINKIKTIINGYSYNSATYIITLFALSGMGKSYILNSVYFDFLFKRDIVNIDFECSEVNDLNYQLLCKVILYLNFGNIFLYTNLQSKNDKEILMKNIEVKAKNNSLTNNDFFRLIDGCNNVTIATSIINELVKKCIRNKNFTIISNKDGRINKLLLLDDIQYLNNVQFCLIEIICHQAEITKKNITIILSGTKGKFDTLEKEQRFKEISINTFSINGLNELDKLESLKNIFIDIDNKDSKIIDRIIPNSPLLAYEVVYNLKALYDNNGIVNLINDYHICIDGAAIFQNKFKCLNRTSLQLLDIICIFKLGINDSVLEDYYHLQCINIRAITEFLEKERVIIKKDNIIKPYHDYCISSYKKYRNGKMYSSNTAKFLEYILKQNVDVDENLVVSNIIKCGNKYFKKYSNRINKIIIDSIQNSNFGTALYYCEYYYNILKYKEVELYTKEDLYYLYLYADCLVHCGKSSEAERIFEWLCKISKPGTLENTESGVSLLNQRFWHLNTNEIIGESLILQNSVEKLLKSKLSNVDTMRMKKAWEGCVNRRMVTHLLLDQYAEAQETYIYSLKRFVQSSNSTFDFCRNTATIIMDYARGIAFNNISKSKKLMSIANKYFSKDYDSHYRRATLCGIDGLLFTHINGEQINENDFIDNMLRLKKENFTSEYFKATLKLYACKLVDESRIIKEANGKSYKTSTLNEMYNAAHNIMLDMSFNPEYRERYLYNILISYMLILNNEHEKALTHLKEAKEFITPAGETHQISINHNIKNIMQIKRIDWLYEGQKIDNDCYYVDCRFW